MKKLFFLLLIFASPQIYSQVFADIVYSATITYKDSISISYGDNTSANNIIFSIDTISDNIRITAKHDTQIKKFSVKIGKDTTFQISFYGKGLYQVRKPVIYLYPTKETEIEIKLNLNGTLSNTYPSYNNGWNVIAKPDGDLINTSDDSRHRYLFWDGKINKSYKIADFNTGFVVPADETLEFLDSTLSKMGLNDYEKNDFITFWLPELKQNKYNFVHFLINDDCNEIATLNITPKPDSEVRIYMLFSAINEPISVRPQHLELLTRTGFTLVEWGGMDFKSLMQ